MRQIFDDFFFGLFWIFLKIFMTKSLHKVARHFFTVPSNLICWLFWLHSNIFKYSIKCIIDQTNNLFIHKRASPPAMCVPDIYKMDSSEICRPMKVCYFWVSLYSFQIYRKMKTRKNCFHEEKTAFHIPFRFKCVSAGDERMLPINVDRCRSGGEIAALIMLLTIKWRCMAICW